MKKVYLVDSENVGDVWVPLLAYTKAEEEVVVFYTQRSPHMNYENVRMLKETDREAVFIKCFEGNNALDFQLVSELGYRLCKEPDCEYIIVSNDTGFDAAVRYWSERKMPVRRLSGKECYRMLRGGVPAASELPKETAQKMPETDKPAEMPGNSEVQEPKEAPAEEKSANAAVPECEKTPAEEKSANAAAPECEETPAAERSASAAVQEKEAVKKETAVPEKEAVKEETAAPEEPGVKEADKSAHEAELENVKRESADVRNMIRELLICIRKEYLADFHNALVAFYGKGKGKDLYLKVKNDPVYGAYRASLPEYGQKEKFDVYCHIVFSNSEYAKDEPKDFSEFLYRANGKRNNLNSLRAALTGQYGKDRGMKYYSLFKSHIKIMNHM